MGLEPSEGALVSPSVGLQPTPPEYQNENSFVNRNR
jgi:hypothetical protein